MSRRAARSTRQKPRTRKKPALSKKRRKPGKPAPGEYALSERKLPGRRFVDIPLMKGRVVDSVEFFSTGDGHILTIEFQDKTALSLEIEPRFDLRADLQERGRDDIETIHKWPPIVSEPWARY